MGYSIPYKGRELKIGLVAEASRFYQYKDVLDQIVDSMGRYN